MGSQVKLLLLGTNVGEHGVSPGLQAFGGVPLVSYWMQALKGCTRLLPVHDKVFIIASPETHDGYLAWAADRAASGGFPPSNILNTGIPTSQHPTVLAEIAFAASQIPSLSEGYILAASLDHFLGPSIPLRQVVEHTVIRGKDTLTFSNPPPGHDMGEQAEVLFDMQGTITITGEYANPKVAAVDPSPTGPSDGINSAALAPLLILHRSSLPLVLQAAATTPAPTGSAPKQMAEFVRDTLLQSGKPVYALRLDMAFEVGSAYGDEYGAAFMDYYHTEVDRVAKQGPAAEALLVVTAAAQETGVITRGDKGVEELLEGASQAKRLLLKFDAVAEDTLAARAAARTRGPQSFVKFGVRDELPGRFADVTTRRHVPHKQHPVYETTANEIGRKPPSQLDMPDVYAGSAGGFTKNFAPPTKYGGLATGIRRSKVHHLLDDF